MDDADARELLAPGLAARAAMSEREIQKGQQQARIVREVRSDQADEDRDRDQQ